MGRHDRAENRLERPVGAEVLPRRKAVPAGRAVALGSVLDLVEQVGGMDTMRFTGPVSGDTSGSWVQLHRNKRAIRVDLKQPEGQKLIRRLVADADVFSQNMRPGVIDRLGLGYEDLRAVNADLVYLSVSGFGPTGPYADQPVYDPIVQALWDSLFSLRLTAPGDREFIWFRNYQVILGDPAFYARAGFGSDAALQILHQLRDRGKAAAVQRCGAVGSQGFHMLLRAIAFVALPAVMRIGLRRFAHKPVAIFLGQDRCSANRGFLAIPAHDSARGPAPFGQAALRRKVAVNHRLVRLATHFFAQPLHRLRHRLHRSGKDVDAVNLLDIDNADTEGATGADLALQALTRTGGKLL